MSDPVSDGVVRALQVHRSDISQSRLVETVAVPLETGQARLRSDVVGLSTNNVTYAALGDSFRYWDHFPTGDPEWGSVPVWGFADVVESRAEGVEVGERFFGYLPSAEQVVVTPQPHEVGFRDAAAHREGLPSSYLSYSRTSTDRTWSAKQEPLQAVYRPLFWTSFMLADWTVDHHPDATVLLTSASAKTAYVTALLLRGAAPGVVGMTSPRNRAFVEATGLYDEVVSYGDELRGDDPVVVLDFLGDDDTAAATQAMLGGRHVARVVAGITDQTSDAAGDLAGSAAIFFAPTQLRKRLADWGREGIEQQYAEAWRRFTDVAPGLVDLAEQEGPDPIAALHATWQRLQAGDVDPRQGLVLRLGASG